jgi:hypothetical protein
MCLHGKVAWNRLLICSVNIFRVSEGALVIDDKNHNRSKNTTTIYGIHKQRDKNNWWVFHGAKQQPVGTFVLWGILGQIPLELCFETSITKKWIIEYQIKKNTMQ